MYEIILDKLDKSGIVITRVTYYTLKVEGGRCDDRGG
jgi:hypothetical protein